MEKSFLTKHGRLDFNKKTLIMGILNVTPDSFSDGGKYTDIDQAVIQAKKMVADGADIIDVGGESTRPGYTSVTIEEEIARVVPIIKSIRKAVSVPISIDTFKSQTAEAAIKAGANIINDVWGAKYDPAIAKVAADYQVPIILMHNRKEAVYQNLIEDMEADLLESIAIAKAQGVKDNQIILDPGIGFAKSMEENLTAIRQIAIFKEMGYPVLLGTSRKRIIGHILNSSIAERDEGTAATTAYGIINGADFVRVHNVAMNAKVAKMTDSLVGKGDHYDG